MLGYLPLFASLASAATLYATHYSGSVYTLSLTHRNGKYDLSLASDMTTCGGMPSWLTLDCDTSTLYCTGRTLYCSDETGDATTNGTLTSYTVGKDGSLTQLAKVVDVGGGVHSVVYEGDDGAKYIAIAHYSGSAVSTFALPIEDGDEPLQILRYQTPPGPLPQQDSSHPHQIILDPTGSFILIPDLGTDQVRVYAIDKQSGQLNTCPSLNYTPGSGPRHGLFWSSHHSHRDGLRIQKNAAKTAPQTMLYTVSELSRHFHAFAVSYLPSGCLGFRETQDFVPYPGGATPEGASLAELQQAGSNLYASIRSDHAFSGNDSLATLTRSQNGTVTFQELTSSHGLVPRTFVINKAGTLVAIGDQSTSNVAIVARDPASGKLGDLVANIQVGEPGKPGTSTGLSSVIWAE
ncbi:hypothetical protein CNMCM6805_008677 [Aspergillus fumigatiaffinis]|uniref:6-phosphogluconolactonase n=1 Tax=Aspergillus fumigatiaffinis TaxID=340414 RepID=A0A8H4HF09_9EURO|nr:hypothetical protein CNMCM5878_004473 [Aspergillus fumigatiaffinis]KAF4225280.1 hypothetical protein CNMCM6457_008326 [Aspergillus fumigatiaffinis]KAF4244425.1 hypothetical protein CNMCM6805_008677 [Aspergillus fumigatiaffinis]